VRFDDPAVITHAKMLVTDECALLGSTNWGMAGFSKNREANAIIMDREAVKECRKYFEELWKKCK